MPKIQKPIAITTLKTEFEVTYNALSQYWGIPAESNDIPTASNPISLGNFYLHSKPVPLPQTKYRQYISVTLGGTILGPMKFDNNATVSESNITTQSIVTQVYQGDMATEFTDIQLTPYTYTHIENHLGGPLESACNVSGNVSTTTLSGPKVLTVGSKVNMVALPVP